jgi:casein kinase II subunit beta
MEDMSDDSNHPRGANGDNDIDGGSAGWIHWYCTLEGHEYLVEVDEEFIKDPFNLYGLSGSFAQMSKDKMKHLVKMILSPTSPNEEDLADE